MLKDLTVIKRNDKKVNYDPEKIEQAIFKAAYEHVDKEKATSIAKEMTHKVEQQIGLYIENNMTSKIDVDQIQDTVEFVLMQNKYYDIGKGYILYRYNRDQNRKEKEKSILTDEFLSKYKHQPNPFPTELGEFIYYRTYSRWLEDEKRREYWWETVKRAVEYNTSLAPTTQKEAEELFDHVYNLDNFLAGRTLWTASTKSSKKYGMSNFNCSFTVIDNYKAYLDMFHLSMVGSGVGFRVLPEDVEQLEPLKTDIDIIHKSYEPVPKDKRLEHTEFKFDETNSIVTMYVADSKEGWTQALKYYLDFLKDHDYKNLNKIIFNYDSVRPKGEVLKTFGG